MDPINPFEQNDFHCHSKFRPPDIEAIEFKARRVWHDWDDYPPYQKDGINSNNENRKDRAKQRYDFEVKKTQNEIEEMTKRFRLYDDDFEFGNRYTTNPPYEFFSTNSRKQNFSLNNHNNNYQNNNFNYYDSGNNQLPSNNYYSNNIDFAYHNQNNIYSPNKSQNESFSNKNQYESFSNYNMSVSKSGFNNNENGDNVDYEIIKAATLEANLLRQQNEAMKKRISDLKQKLNAQKEENLKVLNQIEESEIDRHKMMDYLSNIQKSKTNC